MRYLPIYVLVVIAALVWKLFETPEWQVALSHDLKSMLIPLAGPVLELINTPSFVYGSAVLIFLGALLVVSWYWARVVWPQTKALRTLRSQITTLPRTEDGAQALRNLGDLLRSHGLFVSGWANLQARIAHEHGIPDTPFSYFVASDEAERRGDAGGLMAALPGYFTWAGLLLTFVGLVAALYFAARGFRSGDVAEARASILQLLNASSFKFMTSVAALASALVVSIAYRLGLSRLRVESDRTVAQIEAYLSLCRDLWRPDPAAGDQSAALIERLDRVIAAVSSLSTQMQRLADRLDGELPQVRHAAE